MTEPSLPSPDLQIVIRRTKPDDSRELGFEVSSRKQELGLNFWDAGSVRLTQEPEDYVRQLVRDIDYLSPGSADDQEIARQRMWGKGGTLFESLFPEDLRRLLWSLRGKISTLQILSDEPHIPWELTRLRSHEGGKPQEGGFLCEEFAVTRWLRGIPETHALPVRRLAIIVPTTSRLAAATEERKDMLAIGSTERTVTEIPAKYLEVTQALAGGTFDAWHFAGHGNGISSIDPNLRCLEFDDHPLRPEDMGAAAGNLGASQRPLMFFNGCHTASGGWALAGLGGWPPVLLNAGAGAFIGSLWAVKDEQARGFAKAFYELFLTGTPIGEAVRQARLRVRDEFLGEPTWLAYTVFAHPLTTCASPSAGIEPLPPMPPPRPPIEPPPPIPVKDTNPPVWRSLQGRIGVSPQWGSSWIDLPSLIDFKKGDRFKLSLGGSAARVIIRFLPSGADPNQPTGVIEGEPFEIPPNRTVEFTLDENRRRIIQISIHGGANPWGVFELGRGNGPVTLESVAHSASQRESELRDRVKRGSSAQLPARSRASSSQTFTSTHSMIHTGFSRKEEQPVAIPFAWQKSFLHAIHTHDVVILHGNIRDLYICRDGQRSFEEPFENTLTRLLSTIDLRTLRLFDPHRKAAELTVGEAGIVVAEPLEDFGAPSFNDTTDTSIARIFAELTGGAQRQAWLLKQMHNLLPYRSGYSPQDNLRLVVLQNLIEGLAPGNKLLLCYLSDTQVPIELAQQLHRVAFVKVPLPDYEERCDFWQRAVDPSLAEDLAKLTDGLALSSLQRVAELGRAQPAASSKAGALSLRDWERVISRFKLGEDKDPFRQITVEQLDRAFDFFTEQEGIQGQEEAVAQAVAMLWKARTHVSALLSTEPVGAPRGCLFFCGPSGVGKTMLAKKIAKFVFGSENAFLRIDMSEYQQDFTVSRLIGAPPGYVGHEAGGVLTNAMAERPFSVVLFDEIEKAHPRVFDLFLQVLSDGRLTDSRGQTVYFSEAILVFTSNLGTRSHEMPQLVEARQSGDPTRVREHFLRAVRDFFRSEISRPELLNRIGNNIVPFNYLDHRDVLVRTVRFYLEMLRRRFDEEYAERRLSLTVDTDAVANFLVEERGAALGELGGRAVLNVLDDALMPALARRLLMLERSQSSGPVVLHVDVGVENNARSIRVHQ